MFARFCTMVLTPMVLLLSASIVFLPIVASVMVGMALLYMVYKGLTSN